MSDQCRDAINAAVAKAAASGDTLFVATVAKTIATAAGAPPKEVARQLTEAGIRAGVTMKFGVPD